MSLSFKPKRLNVNDIRVGAPCPMPWGSMIGSDRVRRCEMCALDIYNISEMSTDEITHLIRNREGRLCIRLYRRADGTVQTSDCPSGLRAIRRKATRTAAATVAAILGLFSISYSQKRTHSKPKDVKPDIIQNFDGAKGAGSIRGVVVDPAGAVVPAVTIFLFRGDENKARKTVSGADGSYSFEGLAEGTYKIRVIPTPGFSKLIVEKIQVTADSAQDIQLPLSLDGKGVVVGIFVEEPMIDFSISGPTPIKITRKDLDRIPGGRPY